MGKVKYHPGDIVGDYGLILKERFKGKRTAIFICPICGKEFQTYLGDVAKNRVKSCGCQIGKETSHRIKNLAGKRFGKLVVIDFAYSDRYAYWNCICDCGNLTTVRGSELIGGHVKSCGCLRKENVKAQQNLNSRNAHNLTGMKFGKLTVIRRSEDKRGKDRSYCWVCKCDCGNIKVAPGWMLTSGKIKSCGCLVSLGEHKINKILNENKIIFVSQKTFDNCRNPETNCLLRFDFYLPDYNLCIEFDGEQHFEMPKKRTGWNTEENFKNIVKRDKIKNTFCLKNNIRLVRIPYYIINQMTLEDLLGDKYVVSKI